MSRYYIQPHQLIDPKDRTRDKRYDRYYDKDGKLVFYPDLSPWTGRVQEPLNDYVQDTIFARHGIIIPPDFVHNIFKTPKDKRIMIRMILCGYDRPGDTTQSSTGADGSDGLIFHPPIIADPNDPLMRKKVHKPTRTSIQMDLIIPARLT